MEQHSIELITANQPPVKVISDRCSGDITINYNITIICKDPVDILRAAERQRINDIFSRRGTRACE